MSPPAWRAGVSGDGTPIYQSKRLIPKEGEPLLVGIRGSWYDITNFVLRHPGGDVLLEFVGRDATAPFVAYHAESVLKAWKPVGFYEFDADAPNGDSFAGAHLKLADAFEEAGFFRTSKRFIASRFGMAAGFLLAALYSVRRYREELSWVTIVCGAMCLAGFWQQSGFLMHDLMHNHLFHDRKLDQRVGWFFGCVCFGVSARWWRDEHTEHHLFVNTVISGVGCSDPQVCARRSCHRLATEWPNRVDAVHLQDAHAPAVRRSRWACL